jgi:methylase of polypeptide subunit release factors
MYEIKLPDNQNIPIETRPEVFIPTYSSELCIKALDQTICRPGSLLDLGCGAGVVAIAAHALAKTTKLYASDYSHSAVQLTIHNASSQNIDINVRQGSLFEPWA